MLRIYDIPSTSPSERLNLLLGPAESSREGPTTHGSNVLSNRFRLESTDKLHPLVFWPNSTGNLEGLVNNIDESRFLKVALHVEWLFQGHSKQTRGFKASIGEQLGARVFRECSIVTQQLWHEVHEFDPTPGLHKPIASSAASYHTQGRTSEQPS